MFTFNKSYFFLLLLIFSIEVYIALTVNDQFVRPYLGDVLVVALLFFLVKAFLNIQSIKVIAGILLFCFIIEFLQFIQIVSLLGLDNFRLARIIIGTSFSWLDLLAYMAGAVIILIYEILISS